MMDRASADITKRARENWLLRKRNPAHPLPRVELKHDKPAGSKVLIHGEWVRAEDEAERKRAPPSRFGGMLNRGTGPYRADRTTGGPERNQPQNQPQQRRFHPQMKKLVSAPILDSVT